jgi:hypothetical protein
MFCGSFFRVITKIFLRACIVLSLVSLLPVFSIQAASQASPAHSGPGPNPDTAAIVSGDPGRNAGGLVQAQVTLASVPDRATASKITPHSTDDSQTPTTAAPEEYAQPQAVGAVPNIQVEGLPNNSGWVTAVADDLGNLYIAFEYYYVAGCSGGCYAVVAGKSPDNGRSWDLRVVWADAASSARRPSIAIDDGGQLYIALELYYGSRWYPAYAMSTNMRDVSAWDIYYYNSSRKYSQL